MSYLKLDRTRINYSSPSITRGGIILSQVLDSKCGPENPVLVSSTTDLDLYFGRSFREREYFEELLSWDVNLMLSTPTKSDDQGIPILDTSDFKIISKILAPETEEEIEIRFYDQLPEVGEEGVKYYVSGEDEYYIYHDWVGDGERKEWTRVSDIPLKINPGSTSNRDTLRLTNRGWGDENKIPWCWPKYSSQDWTPEYIEKCDENSLLQSLNSESPDRYIGFVLDFSEVGERIKGDGDQLYLVIPIPDGEKKIQFYVGSPLELDVVNSKEDFQIPDSPLEDQIHFIIKELHNYGWESYQYDDKGLVYKLYSKDLLQDLEFYNIPGLKFHNDPDTTHNILSILSERHKRAEFFSRILGSGDEEIKLEIEQIQGKTEWYRVTISRYEYQEVFEGPLYRELDEDTDVFISLEKTINQLSSLVTIRVYDSWSRLVLDESGEEKEIKIRYSKDNPSDGLPCGEFVLSRSIPLSPWNPDDFWRGLEKLEEFGVSEDFLMVPRIEEYLEIGAQTFPGYYKEYKRFLDYATTKNCQVLISNYNYLFECDGGMNPAEEDKILAERPTENIIPRYMYLFKEDDCVKAESWDGGSWKFWGSTDTGDLGRWPEIKETFSDSYKGNQIFNYTSDRENRLVYFYQNMTYHGWERPSWYIFLRGILSGEYSIETDNIIYNSPSEYYTEDDKPGEILESYKSNFLSYNGHIYYYRRFFSHPGDWKYDHTILSRFCLDKVTNTITRDFPAYLAKETTGEIIRGLQGILLELKSRYPIIYSLDLDYIEEDPYDKSLSIYLNLGIRETLDKDVKLSVTLNFNFT